MKTIIFLVILASCGKPTKDCRSAEEMILRCQAEKVSVYFPQPLPDWEINNCKQLYVVQSCY